MSWVKNDFLYYVKGRMSREIVLDQHYIEGWGVWWSQWQKDTKEHLRKQAMSPQVSMNDRVNRFSELHLSSVGPEGKGLLGDSTTSLINPYILLSK